MTDAARGPARRSFWDRLRDRVARDFNRIFRNRNHVYVFDPSSSPPPLLGNLEVRRFGSLDEIPAALREEFDLATGPPGLQSDRSELGRHAVLWLALLDGRAAGAMLSRRGEHYRFWLVPVQAADLILFKARTLPAQRGRGVYPALMREIIARELPAGGRAFVDCKVHNAASIRGIEKAGFGRAATVKKTWGPEEDLR